MQGSSDIAKNRNDLGNVDIDHIILSYLKCNANTTL